jgi:NADH-quinone oxidoreductase subunit N
MFEAFVPRSSKKALAFAGIGGLFLILLMTWLPLHQLDPSTASAHFYTLDGLSLFFKRFMLVMTMMTLVMSVQYVPAIERSIPGEAPGCGVAEFFILPIFACASLMWLVSAINFIMLFVSLECMSIVLYVSIAYFRKNSKSLEAGSKYLILSALATGFLIYGITWIFGTTGTMSINKLGEAIAGLPSSSLTPLLFGIALILVSFCFKIAAFPFQFWLPDVYQGAPTPITAFLSVASKAGGFVILLRLLEQLYTIPLLGKKLLIATTALAIMTLLFGNLAALAQTNMKRLLAYSSIAHTGYLLMAVASIGAPLAGMALEFYFVAYLLMTSLSFLILQIVSENSGGEEIHRFQGLHQRSPFLAAAMTVAMASLAGLPLTVGFFGKFLIFEVALQQHHYGLIIIGTITVVAGLYYYLKVVRAMYWQQPLEGASPIVLPKAASCFIGGLVTLILVLGIYPAPLFLLFK